MDIKNYTKEQQLIFEALEEVMDPEIPGLAITDLGIVTKITVLDAEAYIQLTPTFSGCPALRIIEEMVLKAVQDLQLFDKVVVKTTFDDPWNTDKISEKGRAALLKHGLTPPPKNADYLELDVLSDTPCPFCNSKNTTLKSPFGATLCRSMHYCNNCLQAFEGFKPLT